MENPFFSTETTEGYELPILPFMSAGDPAQIQGAADLSRWLYEIGYVGSDECVANAAAVFEPFQQAFREFSDERGIEPVPYDSSGAELEAAQPSLRALVIGTAAIYGWQE